MARALVAAVSAAALVVSALAVPAGASVSDFTLSPDPLDLGSLPVGTPSTVADSVTVTNTGGTDLRVNSIAIDGPAGFSLGATNCVVAAIGPGGSCQIEVRARPAAEGLNTATLRVGASDGTQRASTVQITGDGAPSVEITSAPPALTSSRDATIAFTATDDGPLDIRCSLDGGATAPGCQSPFVVTGLSDGPHEVSVIVTDALGQTRTDTATWTVDATAPVLSVPAGISVDATSPTGAVVGYDASASDAVDPAVPVRCQPASGSTFAIGDTTVTCTATDDAGNSASRDFVVHVSGAGEQVSDLRDDVQSADIPVGTRISLVNQLDRAGEAIRVGNRAEACTALADFTSHVRAQRGKKIAAEYADALIAAARRAGAVLAC